MPPGGTFIAERNYLLSFGEVGTRVDCACADYAATTNSCILATFLAGASDGTVAGRQCGERVALRDLMQQLYLVAHAELPFSVELCATITNFWLLVFRTARLANLPVEPFEDPGNM